MSVGGKELEREGGMLKYRRMRPLRWSSFTSTSSDEVGGVVDDDIVVLSPELGNFLEFDAILWFTKRLYSMRF